MTYKEWIILELIKKKQEIQKLIDTMSELENELHGREVSYEGSCAIIEYVDGDQQEVQLSIEEEDGTSHSLILNFDDFLEVIYS